MTDEDIRLLEETIERQGTVSGDDARRLIAELRRRGRVITQMQQAIDYLGDTVPAGEEPAATHDPVGAEHGAPRLTPRDRLGGF